MGRRIGVQCFSRQQRWHEWTISSEYMPIWKLLLLSQFAAFPNCGVSNMQCKAYLGDPKAVNSFPIDITYKSMSSMRDE